MADGWISDEDVYVPPVQVTQSSKLYYNTNRHEGQYDVVDNGDVLEIAPSMVGRVIGKGGAVIKELQSKSGARINISRDTNENNKTPINLSGTQEAKDLAKQLIKQLFEVRPKNNTHRREQNFNNSHNEDSSYRERNFKPRYEESSNRERNFKPRYEESSNRERNFKPRYEDSSYNYQKNSAPGPTYDEASETSNFDSMDWEQALEENRKQKEAYWATFPKIIKDFYIEDPDVANLDADAVDKWRLETNNITVKRVQQDPKECLKPIKNPVTTFEQAFQSYPEILEIIYKQNFKLPSPIQSQAWPVLLSGEDLIGIAQTGTGKTLAFLLPALIHIQGQTTPIEERNGPNVLILAPTRELAVQIHKEVQKFQYAGFKSVCVYGGASRENQIGELADGVQIIIATPGRLNDLVKAKYINVEAVTYLVLDEADRMLDMGFGPQIRVSLLEVRPDRQTVMTSATWPAGVQRLAELYMKNPIQVIVGSLDLAAVHSVQQELIFVNDDIEEKFEILLQFLDTLQESDKVIVFCSKRTTTITIATDLALKKYNFQSIYGGLEQCDREQALEDMRNDSVNILVATDVASRGIDIENVTHIINFDFPTSLEEFVHRVGRTGRAGRSGKAITYISRRDWDKAEGLINILEEAGQVVPDELVAMAERYKRHAANPTNKRFHKRGSYNRYDY